MKKQVLIGLMIIAMLMMAACGSKTGASEQQENSAKEVEKEEI